MEKSRVVVVEKKNEAAVTPMITEPLWAGSSLTKAPITILAALNVQRPRLTSTFPLLCQTASVGRNFAPLYDFSCPGLVANTVVK